MLRFGIKSAIMGTAIYFTVDKGVWNDSVTTNSLYKDLEKGMSPYVGDMKKQIPYDLPPLPSNDRISYLMKHYWNCGVKSTFKFLVDLPEHTINGISATYSFVSSIVDDVEPSKNE